MENLKELEEEVQFFDHIAIQVATNRLATAVNLFIKFGYVEDIERRIVGDWGEARFVVKQGSIPIQLTLPKEQQNWPFTQSECHIALQVDDPRKVSAGVSLWAQEAGISTNIDTLGDQRIVLTLPNLLMVSIELVPQVLLNH